MAKKKLAQAADYAATAFTGGLSNEQVDAMEQAASHPDHGCARRIGLHVLTQSKEQLLEGVDKSKLTALLDAHAAVHAYVQHLDAVRSLMCTAEIRLLIVAESAIQASPRLAGFAAEGAAS